MNENMKKKKEDYRKAADREKSTVSLYSYKSHQLIFFITR